MFLGAETPSGRYTQYQTLWIGTEVMTCFMWNGWVSTNQRGSRDRCSPIKRSLIATLHTYTMIARDTQNGCACLLGRARARHLSPPQTRSRATPTFCRLHHSLRQACPVHAWCRGVILGLAMSGWCRLRVLHWRKVLKRAQQLCVGFTVATFWGALLKCLHQT